MTTMVHLATGALNGSLMANTIMHPASYNVAANGLVGSGTTMIMDNNNGVATTNKIRDTTKYDRWEYPRHRLKFYNILGEGAFGQVWRCEAIDIASKSKLKNITIITKIHLFLYDFGW